MTCTIISTGEELNIACKNENEHPYPEIKEKLRNKIWELYCKGYDTFWCNCEYGAPLWCAEIITALAMYNDIVLNIAMPYEEQSTNWVDEYRESFFNVHAHSNHVELISRHYNENCYKQADEYMIDDSDLVIIVGKADQNDSSGKYAKSIGVKVESFPI